MQNKTVYGKLLGRKIQTLKYHFHYSIIITSKQIKQIKQISKSQKHRLLYQYSKLNNELKTTQDENNGIRRIWAQSWRYVVG